MINKIDHRISLDKASDLKMKYRSKHPEKPKKFVFDAKQVAEVIAQPGVEFVEIAPALKDDDSETLVVSGLDGEGAPITNLILEEAMGCPPFCGV